ncbi:MAG: hypothetical protein ACK4OO_07430, partial [bacterium]
MMDRKEMNFLLGPAPEKLEAVLTEAELVHGERMVLQMGPQHPATHGVLRLELVTDGEMVV